MHRSAKEGNLEEVRMYLENLRHDKNPGAKVKGHWKGTTPMHIAAKFGHLNVVQLIQTTTGVANPADANRFTVLHMAAFCGKLEIVQELVKDLVNKNPADADGITVLHYGAEQGHLKIVKELVKDLKNKNPVATGFHGRTPLHQAALNGHLQVTKFLCQNNPDIAIVDSDTRSNALHLAAYKGHMEVVKFLADKIPINIKDKYGDTASDSAKSEGHQSIVKYLTNLRPGLPQLPPLPPPIPTTATMPTQLSQPCCRALYDFEARSAGELSFKKDDLIMLKSKVNENFYDGSIPSKSVFRRSKSGYFPCNYVTIVVPLPK